MLVSCMDIMDVNIVVQKLLEILERIWWGALRC